MCLLSFPSHAAPSRHANRCQLPHIYGNGGCAYDSERENPEHGVFFDGAGRGSAAVCRAGCLRTGPAGGAGALRRPAAALAVPVPHRVHTAHPMPGGGCAGAALLPSCKAHRGPRSVGWAGAAHRLSGRLCPRSKCRRRGRPLRAAHRAGGRCAPPGLCLFRSVLCDTGRRAVHAGQCRAGRPTVPCTGGGGLSVRRASGAAGRDAWVNGTPRCPGRFAASPAGRHHRAGVPDLPQALRLRPVFPDAGRRSGESAALRCRRFLRDAFGGLLRL
jgi:hypothetical protein